MDCKLFLILLSSFILPRSSSYASPFILKGGSSLSVENPADVLISPNGVFTAGFYPVGENAYSFAIWFSKPTCSNNCTIVWMANRDYPVNGKGSELLLQKTGNLILVDGDKSTAWSTDTHSNSPVELRLNNSGNLCLQNMKDGVMWQSFQSPTDTLLPLQPFTRHSQLVSARSRTNYSTGFYRLIFDYNNLMRLIYDGPDVSSVYWPYPWLQDWDNGRFPYNSSRIASFDLLGEFLSSDNWTFRSADYGRRLQRRLTLDSDGNFRMYSREKESAEWVVSWQSKPQSCEIHGVCGPNSTCNYDPFSGTKCSCLPGYKIKNSADWSFGCEPKFNLLCDHRTEAMFFKLEHVEFYGGDTDVYKNNITLEMCRKYCMESCNCKGFQYRYIGDNPVPYCYQKILLTNGRHSSNFGGDFYVKVPKSFRVSDKETYSGSQLTCSSQTASVDRPYSTVGQNETLRDILWLACALGGVEVAAILFIWFFLKSQKDSNEATETYNPAAVGFERFSYSTLKKVTRNFSQEIGRGAGGTVYKAVLVDNRVAAVKKLSVTDHGEAEFLAEVSTIGNLNHMNLIELWGYCAEGKHRLLVYEFMEHGSLTENLSSNSLDWNRRFEIALGTARGLAYLHEECLEWVLHCDVKPDNILLDSNYQPKVSDFGLSKLLSRADLQKNHSAFSRIRGTRGYMAPEWVYNLPITSKVDVYSYGIVVLEMITGKSQTIGSNGFQTTGEMEHTRLATLVKDKKMKSDENTTWFEDIVDPRLEGNYDMAKMKILITISLQCVEEDRDARPTMREVVEMLMHH